MGLTGELRVEMSEQAFGGGFNEAVEKLRAEGRPFAVATVINVKGSASAKPGSRAVIDETGKNVWGWVGGGCAESFVGREAVLAMEENRTRIVQADLDDEIFGLGMPCGGIMDVFIHPQLPPETLALTETAELESTLRHLASTMGFELEYKIGDGARLARPVLERGIYGLALAIAAKRGVPPEPLRTTKGVYKNEAQPNAHATLNGASELLILGNSRITEEIAKLATVIKMPVRVYGVSLDRSLYPASVVLEDAGPGYENLKLREGTAVIVASHHKGDHEFLRLALSQHAGYVGLIASQKRSGLVFEYLRSVVSQDELRRIYAPCGLNMACRSPSEIALSCLAELVMLRAEVPS